MVEDAVLLFLAAEGTLEKHLKALGCLDDEIKSIKGRLKSEYPKYPIA